MDFFTVPTLTFVVLYGFLVIAHDRRRIIHFNVTKHPTSAWIVQQLREAFPYDSAPGYLIFDRGANFDEEVIDTIERFGVKPKRTCFRSPWQNGVAERWVPPSRQLLPVRPLNSGIRPIMSPDSILANHRLCAYPSRC
jgi:hypothetical protein